MHRPIPPTNCMHIFPCLHHDLRTTPSPIPTPQGDDKLLGTAAKPFSPMVVVGDINGDGLGCTAWWAG